MQIDEKTGEEVTKDGAIVLRPLSEAGEGATIVAVADRNGAVVLQFPKAVQWCSLDPQTAVMVGEAMARAAHKIRTGREPPPNTDALANEIKRKATDMIRQMMIQRTLMIMTSMLKDRKPMGRIANEIVDRILMEVT